MCILDVNLVCAKKSFELGTYPLKALVPPLRCFDFRLKFIFVLFKKRTKLKLLTKSSTKKKFIRVSNNQLLYQN